MVVRKRMANSNNPNADFEDAHFGERELKRIIFGCKISADNCNELQQIAATKYPHVEFYEAIFKEFEMEIHRIDKF